MLGVAASIFVARMIGKVGLGELGIVQGTVGMFSTLAGMGLGLTATKHVAEHRLANPGRVGETIGLLSLISWGSGIVMTVVVFLLSPWLARHTLAAPQLALELETGSLLLLFGVINGVQTGILSGFEAFKRIARINLICGLANFPLLVCGAYFGGLMGIVCGLVAGLALNFCLNFFAVRHETSVLGIAITYRHVHKHMGLLWTFGLPGMLSGLIFGPANWIASTMLVNQHGGYAEMGVLNAANNWFQAVAFLPSLLGQVLLPVLSSHVAAKDNAGVKKALSLVTWANLILVVPVVLAGCLCSKYIMRLYGPEFISGWPVLVWTLISVAVVIAQSTATNQLVAMSKMWVYFACHVGWGGCFVLATYFLVPSYGGAGMALARLIAYSANWLFIAGSIWWLARPKSEPVAPAQPLPL